MKMYYDIYLSGDKLYGVTTDGNSCSALDRRLISKKMSLPYMSIRDLTHSSISMEHSVSILPKKHCKKQLIIVS